MPEERTNVENVEKDYVHKVYPKQFAREDFWSQIKRTVNGQPVSEEDIALIVHQVAAGLELNGSGHLLDLGCGNGALGSRFFDRVDSYTGVDFSEYLLEIANEYFRPHENIRYVLDDMVSFVEHCASPLDYGMLLCYGCMSYLPKDQFVRMMAVIRERFENVSRIFIGNIPDRAKAGEFHRRRNVMTPNLDDPQSALGVWWDVDEVEKAMKALGYRPQVLTMPPTFYGAGYRFDLGLSRN